MSIWTNRNWTPMLLQEIPKPFNSKDYLYELKFDGIRAVIFVNKREIKIQSRNQQDLTNLFPELQEIKKQVTKNVIFDGEIIALRNGLPSFRNIQKRLHLKNSTKILNASRDNPVVFMAFDILYENKELINNNLITRKQYLQKYADSDCFIKTKAQENNGCELFRKVKKLGLEGIVAKNKNSTYHIDKRTDDFIKIKNIKRDEFVIGGYELKKNEQISLALGEMHNKKLVFVGKVTIRKINKIYSKILQANPSENYFTDFNDNITYIKPTLTCHVEYLERTINNHLRHPIYKDI